jgi:hypothetical protein
VKRNTIQILALIGAISAGGVAHANQGYISGHHELPENTAVHSPGSFSNGDVQHLDRYSDGTLMSEQGSDRHHGAIYTRDTFDSRSDVNGPLPPEADVNR